MKVIFLDIDGVLNSHQTIERAYKENGERMIIWQIDRGLTQRLNRIIAETGAKVVISSTWRHDMDKVFTYLNDNGFEGEIIGRTPKLWKRRGFEIQKWLDENPGVDVFVIIDDDSDMEHLHPYHVHTSTETGLQDRHVEECIKRLNRAAPRAG